MLPVAQSLSAIETKKKTNKNKAGGEGGGERRKRERFNFFLLKHIQYIRNGLPIIL
jgi:hypothetical protein